MALQTSEMFSNTGVFWNITKIAQRLEASSSDLSTYGPVCRTQKNSPLYSSFWKNPGYATDSF